MFEVAVERLWWRNSGGEMVGAVVVVVVERWQQCPPDEKLKLEHVMVVVTVVECCPI